MLPNSRNSQAPGTCGPQGFGAAILSSKKPAVNRLRSSSGGDAGNDKAGAITRGRVVSVQRCNKGLGRLQRFVNWLEACSHLGNCRSVTEWSPGSPGNVRALISSMFENRSLSESNSSMSRSAPRRAFKNCSSVRASASGFITLEISDFR